MTGAAVRNEPRAITSEKPRRGALIAGLGLLVMSILSGLANAELGRLTVSGDAARTAAGIAAHKPLFGAVAASFLVVAVLDVVVAWGLYLVLEPVSRRAALLAAWMRVAYAAMFVIAIGELFNALRLVNGGSVSTVRVLDAVNAFQKGWTVMLALFGLHLIVVAWLVLRSSYIPSWLGVLVAIAGLGYVVDGAGTVLSAGYGGGIAGFTFAGEVLLMVWLLWRGRRMTIPQPS
jgi:hypothetical protein